MGLIAVNELNELSVSIPLLSEPPTAEAFDRMLAAHVPPGIQQLIQLIAQDADALQLPIYLVGGFVRDLLLGRPSLDLDFTVDGSAPDLAALLEADLGGQITVHPPFLTATWTPGEEQHAAMDLPQVDGEPLTVDLVTARREIYAHSGALPTVKPGALADDLFRRDFTLNALAIQLLDYHWVDLHGGFSDLRDGLLRVLHPRSFQDDPTRITRGARFSCRFGFQFAPETAALIATASPSIATVSGDRWRAELLRIFAEPDPAACLNVLDQFAVLTQIVPGVSFIENDRLYPIVQDLQKALLADQRVSGFESASFIEAIWTVLSWGSTARTALTDRLKLPPDILIRLKAVERGLALLVDQPMPAPSVFVHALEPIDLSGCAALWAILPLAQRPLIERYIREWRVRQPIATGADLRARGLQPGPAFGMLLKQLRDAWLDGAIDSPQAEQVLLAQLIEALPETSTSHRAKSHT